MEIHCAKVTVTQVEGELNMATVVNGGTDSGSGAAMMIMALVVAAVVGLAVWFFAANGGAPTRTENFTIEAPKMSAPAAPAPSAPPAPAPAN